MYISKHTRLAHMRNHSRDAVGGMMGKSEPPKAVNVDWIGRWFIVPSYIVVIVTSLIGGWGFK